MQESVKLWKKLGFVGSQLVIAGFGGTCLPDNILANTAGEIVNGLILSGVNLVLTGTGIQV